MRASSTSSFPPRRPVAPGFVLSAVTAVAALAGCATAGGGYHYSELLGARYFRAPIDTYPVIVTRVDGRSTPLRQSPALIEPGLRQVTVQGPPVATGDLGDTRTIALDVAPCTRYWLVAVKTSPLVRDFTVRVDHEEPVAGCTPRPA